MFSRLKLSKYTFSTSSGLEEIVPTTENTSLKLLDISIPLKLNEEESTIRVASSFITQSRSLKWK